MPDGLFKTGRVSPLCVRECGILRPHHSVVSRLYSRISARRDYICGHVWCATCRSTCPTLDVVKKGAGPLCGFRNSSRMLVCCTGFSSHSARRTDSKCSTFLDADLTRVFLFLVMDFRPSGPRGVTTRRVPNEGEICDFSPFFVRLHNGGRDSHTQNENCNGVHAQILCIRDLLESDNHKICKIKV